jgi:hypothetical protein
MDLQPGLTIGELRVRTQFNPAMETGNGDIGEVVEALKQGTATIINLVETLKEKDPRLAALAQTAYEEACMWAVKLATA